MVIHRLAPILAATVDYRYVHIAILVGLSLCQSSPEEIFAVDITMIFANKMMADHRARFSGSRTGITKQSRHDVTQAVVIAR